MCRSLADSIEENEFKNIYGIPTGGLFVAYELSDHLRLPLTEVITPQTLIVDDILDSGATIQRIKGKYPNNKVAVLITKPYSPKIYDYKEVSIDNWINFFYEHDRTEEDVITRTIQLLGDNPTREGLKDTPQRVAKMWKELFRGYDIDRMPAVTLFNNGQDGIHYDQMIIDQGYFFSHCEHHLVPFFGDYYFAYIPDKLILGLSKVARIVDYYSARLQVQERLVKEITDHLQALLMPKGIALIMKARHLCKEMRGVQKVNGKMITSELRGVFKDKFEVRQEFLQLIHD